MKKLNISNGGHRAFYNDDLTHLNEAIQELQAGLGGTFAASYMLNNTVPVYNAGFWDIAAGYMVYKGEVCAYDAQHVADVVGQTLAWVPVTAYRALDPITYADLGVHSPHEIKKVTLTFYAVAPADYVNVASMITFSQAVFNNAFTSIYTSMVPGLLNGWAVTPGRTPGYGLDPAGRRVWLRGEMDASAAASHTFYTLPVGVRPNYDRIIPMGTSGYDSYYLKIKANGDMSAEVLGGSLNNAQIYYIDGLSFLLT